MSKKSKAKINNEGPDLVEINVADRLASLRKEQKITLEKLGSMAGLSDAYLSRVENHRTAVTLSNLGRLANALGVSVSVFFEDYENECPMVLCRSGEGKKIFLRGKARLPTRMLAANKLGKLMEPIVVDIGSVKNPMKMISHSGEEFNYVVQSECDFFYGKEVVHLEKGDSVYYDASVPHTMRAPEGGNCRVLSVVASKDYLFHGDLGRLLQDG